MLILGCDPGVSGAVALVNQSGFLDLFDIPCEHMETSGRTKRKISAAGLAEQMREVIGRHGGSKEYVEVWLEDVHAMPMAKSGSGANTSLMHSKGVIEGVCGALGYRLFLVGARTWKAMYGATADKKGTVKLARDLYPDAPIKLAKHHNRAESLLIARYGMKERF